MALYPPKSELFDTWINNKPESKLELIDGRLIVGNSLTGSRLLLRQILQGWRADAAIALAPIDTWLQSLAAGYDLTLPQTGSPLEILNHLEEQVADIEFVPEDLQAGRAEITWAHHNIQQQLTVDSFRLANEAGCESLGRDFVMRLGDNGHYHPSSIPGLAFRPDALWNEDEDYNPLESRTFKVEQPIEDYQRIHAEEGPKWGSLLFIPNIQSSPVPICFEEYISWCPRAKFEFIEGKPLINSTPGTRNVLAMLLMTFGLESAVKLLPPQAWIEGLRQRLEWEQHDAERKAEWWKLARQAAEQLRAHFDLGRLGVIGDLTMPQPLNYWSDITLVYWVKFDDSWKAFDVLHEIDPDLRIDLMRFQPEWLTADQLWQVDRHLVEL